MIAGTKIPFGRGLDQAHPGVDGYGEEKVVGRLANDRFRAGVSDKLRALLAVEGPLPPGGAADNPARLLLPPGGGGEGLHSSSLN